GHPPTTQTPLQPQPSSPPPTPGPSSQTPRPSPTPPTGRSPPGSWRRPSRSSSGGSRGDRGGIGAGGNRLFAGRRERGAREPSPHHVSCTLGQSHVRRRPREPRDRALRGARDSMVRNRFPERRVCPASLSRGSTRGPRARAHHGHRLAKQEFTVSIVRERVSISP